jgi:hypothetical protein
VILSKQMHGPVAIAMNGSNDGASGSGAARMA